MMEPPKPLPPPEALPMLREGINLTLSRWSALQMAVENEWGGPHSRDNANKLCDDIFNWFTQSKDPLYIDDLEGLLEKGLDSFNTDADDGSIEEVSENLMILHEECIEENYSSVEKLREASANRTVRAHVRQVVNGDDDSDSDSDNMGEADSEMMVDSSPPSAAPITKPVDEQGPAKVPETEDGWTVVGPRKSKGKMK